ncbi:hypothetical protein ACP70R_021190 [Stipagrostis hirtigluma subsp. patula]
MAATNAPSAVGPAPFKDVCGAVPVPDGGSRRRRHHLERHQARARHALLPGHLGARRVGAGHRRHPANLRAAPRRRRPREPPKSGTTWLKSLAFATMARAAPPAHPEHPLLHLNPHDCVPFMEMLIAAGCGSQMMEALPSPRLMATHMHHSLLPASIRENSDCKIIYICREPKDMLVSMWHYGRKIVPNLLFSELFEHACEGILPTGPIWDHVLGYWNASKESPETVLFLRYEEVLHDAVNNVRKIAQFVGQPFSVAEEEAGAVMDILRLCS